MNIASPLGHERNYHHGSLVEQIEEECLSSTTHNSRISSLILKFYYLCVTGENPENSVSYADAESVYHDSQLLLLARRTFKLGNNPFLPTESAMQIVRNYPRFWNHIQSIGNELRMIGDIPATTLIFRDIIERAITSKKDKEQFVGLDLGTGTGILVLALYILARKKSCDEIQLYGISDSETGVEHVRTVMTNIGCPAASIIEGDTTQKNTYERIQIPHISMACNENVPFHAENIHSEPFLHNLAALRESGKISFFQEAQFFPRRVTISHNGSIIHDCSPENDFLLDQIAPEKSGVPHLRYAGIEVGGNLIPLRDFHRRAAEILGLPACHDATVRW